MSAGSGLRILLLGGFECWHRGEPLRGFESQKVRALLAYLVLERGRPVRRERLAALFWGEKDEESARRNLRQALYNLKSTLPGDGAANLRVDTQEILLEPGEETWIDVDAFERALDGPGPAGFHELAAAVQLYRGDLLAGLLLKECAEFEEWLVTTQERLRDAALDALRRLVGAYLERGDYRLGVQHARRLVAMDPLYEEAHRQLLRLYELAGQRGRALAHYTDLRELLRRELGVEPLPATRALYESILAEALRADAAREKPEPLGPIVPLAGRRDAFSALGESWRAVVEGATRATLLVGEEGIGKTRLARSFLDAASSSHRLVVLTGTCLDPEPRPSLEPIAEAVRQALARLDDGEEPAPALAPALRSELERLAGGAADAGGPGGPAAVDAVAGLLRAFAAGADGAPVALFLDDLQWADEGTWALLAALPERLAGVRAWILGAIDAAAPPPSGGFETVLLERLDEAACEQVAASIVERAEVGTMTALLAEASGGLPLALVALVDAMWDEGDLAADAAGRWTFTGSASAWRARAAEGLDRILLRRVRRLPTSTRRLASMAAVIGRRFETALLERAEDEHAAVVEVGLEILLERWLVRQHRDRWSATGLESSLALWSRGARRGRFEFDHPRLREVLYRDLNPLRRQVLHRQVALALEELHRDRPGAPAARLAHHFAEAGAWDHAFRHQRAAADRALAQGDAAGALAGYERARSLVQRLRQQAANEAERARWQAEEAPLARSISELAGDPALRGRPEPPRAAG